MTKDTVQAKRFSIGPDQSILIVEDSPEDFAATKRAFRKCGLGNPIYHSQDGDEALDFLFRRGEFSAAPESPRPSIILLDLNLPGTDGLEVLVQIKSDEILKLIPVIVLTSSADERDIEKCYRHGANSYVQKPVDIGGFFEAVEKLKDFWFDIVLIPGTRP